ncbi:MAG: 6,7-dimethyl-8-ribityllumazine synthase [Halobacteriaceae archaeon]
MVNIGLVISEFNREITEQMEAEAQETIQAQDASLVDSVYVPGVYDAPLAADRLARRQDIDAVAVIGTIITGDTNHDEVIAHAAAQKITDISVDRDTPITLGVTGPGMSADEAYARTEKGGAAVSGAIDLYNQL